MSSQQVGKHTSEYREAGKKTGSTQIEIGEKLLRSACLEKLWLLRMSCYSRCEIHIHFLFDRHCIDNFSLPGMVEEVVFAENLFSLNHIPTVYLKNTRASVYFLTLAVYKSPRITQDTFPFLSPYFSLKVNTPPKSNLFCRKFRVCSINVCSSRQLMDLSEGGQRQSANPSPQLF